MFAFDNTYATQLEGLYVPALPEPAPEPHLLALNLALVEELGLDAEALQTHGAEIFSGSGVPEGATPLAQAYAGHQFGGLSPQLGDGRAVLLGELLDRTGRRVDLQLKGSGRTPFSRGGDGKAALGPVLREYLMGEAMHALGVPTTRALAAVTTGVPVRRQGMPPGAVLTRIASSHIRVGTFEFFAIRGDTERLERLMHYTLDRHYPDADRTNPALSLLLAVRDAQATLVAHWMGVGFIHGVMNTDNVTVSGETIDFGPCAFMDAHDPTTVFSSIDSQGRYAYGNQPPIAGWNLSRFAAALLPLIHTDRDASVELAQQVVDSFAGTYQAAWLQVMRAKLGLTSEHADDLDLANDLVALMVASKPDHTTAFRRLSQVTRGTPESFVALFEDREAITAWTARLLTRQAQDGPGRAEAMDGVNPLYIPRNHKVEEALAAAVDDGELIPFQTLLEVVEAPFTERPGFETYAEPAQASFTSCYQTFCGT